MDYFVERGREEFATVVGKLNITHRLGMPHIRAQAFSVGQHIPYLHRAVVTARQKQMTKFGEELDSLDTLVVTIPGVQPLFWQIALMLFGPQIGRCINEGLIATAELLLRTVVDRGSPVGLTLLGVAFLGVLEALLTFFLILFH